MTLKEAIALLEEHNIWRRGGEGKMTHPKKLGKAIDTIVNNYKDNKKK